MKETVPLFKYPSTDFLKKQLNLKFDELSGRVKEILGVASHISLSSDVWTECMSERSYLGLTAHYLEATSILGAGLYPVGH